MDFFLPWWHGHIPRWHARSICVLVFSPRQARKDFITAKYTEKRFAKKKCPDATSRLHTLCDAVKARDIFSLIQVYAEGVDLMEPIPLANGHVSAQHMLTFSCVPFLLLFIIICGIIIALYLLPWTWNPPHVPEISCKCLIVLFQEQGETALHLAVRLVDRTSLHIVDFLTQNR